MTTQPRDNQRQRLYDAEGKACASVGHPHWGQTIKNADLQPFVNKVLAKAPVASRWPGRTISVKLTHGGGWAYGNEIRLGVSARNDWIILHEMAHCLTPDKYAPHGPEFAGVFLWLIHTVLGKQSADALRAAYKDCKVRKSNVAIPAPMDRTEKALVERIASLRKQQRDLGVAMRIANEELAMHRATKREAS